MNVLCDQCGQVMAVDEHQFGATVLCGHCHEATSVPVSRFAARMLLDDYAIKALIGTGGMGDVYEAHQLSLDRDIALKVLRSDYGRTESDVQELIAEARNAAKLNHPNIAQAYAVGMEDGVYFFAMELIRGQSVKEMLDAEEPLDIEWSLEVIRQVASGLAHAWSMGMIHRDVKPDNIMIRGHDSAVKLTDLGLAKPVSEMGMSEEDVVGTPQYICPEAMLGKPVDIRGDIYSLGATLFHMVTGRFAFVGDSPLDIARRHVQEPLDPPIMLRPELGESTSRVIEKMMAKDPRNRYADPNDVVTALDALLNHLRGKGKRRRKGADNERLRALQAAATTTTIQKKIEPQDRRRRVVPLGIVAVTILLSVVVAIVVVMSGQPAADVTRATTVKKQDISQRLQPGVEEFGELSELLAEARQYAKDNPKDYRGQIERYRKVRSAGFGSRFHDVAHKEIVRLRALRDRSSQRLLGFGDKFPVYPTQNRRKTGFNYAYYEGEFEGFPDERHTPKLTGISDFVNLGIGDREEQFAVTYNANFVAQAANYTFSTQSKGASRIYIDNRLVIDNSGTGNRVSSTLALAKGWHTIRVEYVVGQGEKSLELGVSQQPLDKEGK